MQASLPRALRWARCQTANRLRRHEARPMPHQTSAAELTPRSGAYFYVSPVFVQRELRRPRASTTPTRPRTCTRKGLTGNAKHRTGAEATLQDLGSARIASRDLVTRCRTGDATEGLSLFLDQGFLVDRHALCDRRGRKVDAETTRRLARHRRGGAAPDQLNRCEAKKCGVRRALRTLSFALPLHVRAALRRLRMHTNSSEETRRSRTQKTSRSLATIMGPE